jgi:hypothetical protein
VNGQFRIRELARWLIQNHRVYVEEYQGSHKNVSARIESRLDTIKIKVNDLVRLDLIEIVRKEKQSKGTGEVDIYKFTPAAYFFSWVTESFNPSKRDRANEEIFRVLVDNILNIENDSAASTIFHHNFYKKCKQQGKFGSMVEFFREPLTIGLPVMTIHSYFDYVTVIENMSTDDKGYFLDLADQTIEELRPEVKDLVVYQIKLEFERTMLSKSHFKKGYEKLRFQSRDLHNAVVVEAHCTKCDHYTSVVILYLEYIKLAKKAIPRPITLTNQNCPACKAADCFTIPSFA